MRKAAIVIPVMLLGVLLVLAETPAAQKKKAPSRATTATTKKTASNKKKSTASKKPATQAPPSWRTSQRTPAPERYKEIQQALAAKGYLEPGAPNGVWDNSSADALKKFQQDQNLGSSGKIDSLSLIALGLGPRRDPQPPPQQ